MPLRSLASSNGASAQKAGIQRGLSRFPRVAALGSGGNLGHGCREAGNNRDLCRLVVPSLLSCPHLRGSWSSIPHDLTFHPDLSSSVAVAIEDQFGLGLRPVHRSSSPSLRPLHLNLRCNPRALSRITGTMTLHSRYTASQLQINSESLKRADLVRRECSWSQTTATAAVTPFAVNGSGVSKRAIFSQKQSGYVQRHTALPALCLR